MADTSLVFSILARSNLAQALQRDAAATRVLRTAFRVMAGGSATDVAKVTAALGALGAAGAGAFGLLGAGAAGAGLAIAGLGVAVVKSNQQLTAAYSSLGEELKATVTSAAAPLVPVLANVASQARTLIGPLGKQLGAAFAEVAPAVQSMVSEVIGGMRPLISAIGPIARAAAPLIQAIGAGLRPVLASLANVLLTVVQTAGRFAPQLEQMFVAVGQLVGALGPLLAGLIQLGAPIIGPLVGLVAQLAGTLASALAPVFAQLGPIIGQIITALQPLVAAFGQLLAAVLPILPPIATLIGQLVGALVPALVPLIGHIANLASLLVSILVPAWQQVVPVFATVIGWVGKIADVILTTLTQAITWLISAVPSAWQQVKSAIGSAVAAIRGVISWFGNLPGLLGGWFGRAKDAAVRKASELLSWIRGLPGRIKSGLGNLGGLLFGAGRALLQGLINGVKSMAGAVVRAAKGVVNSAIQAAKRLLGIASPSKVFTWIGSMTTEGLVKGLLGGVSEAESAVKTLTGTIMAAWRQQRISTVDAVAAAGDELASAAMAGLGAQQRPVPSPYGAQGGRGRSEVTVRLVADGADKELTRLLRKIVRVEGRGNVQMAFGR